MEQKEFESPLVYDKQMPWTTTQKKLKQLDR